MSLSFTEKKQGLSTVTKTWKQSRKQEDIHAPSFLKCSYLSVLYSLELPRRALRSYIPVQTPLIQNGEANGLKGLYL